MRTSLTPCSACARHVRVSEAACPFCGAALPRDRAPRPAPIVTGRLGRAAAFFFGATVTLAACAGDVTEPQSSSGMEDGGPDDDGGTNAHYGLPPEPDASVSDDGGDVPLYGGPPLEDAGTDPDDAGPAPDDAGPDAEDAGMWQGPYGSPPPGPDGGD